MPLAPDDLTGQEDVLPKDDLSANLESALDATQTPATDAPAAPAEAPGTDGERPRDAFGRFKPTQGEGAPAATPKPDSTDGAGVPAAGAADPNGQPPASWTEEAKAGWSKVPAELRPYLHQRDNELQAGFRQVAERANAAAAVINEFMPYQDILTRENIAPVAAIRTLLQTAHALRTGGNEYKKAILYDLARQYNVDMTQGYNPDQAIAEAQLAALTTEKLHMGVQQEQRTEWEVTQTYNAFANDPKNEFFPQVRHVMAGIIGNGFANDLATAYNMALGMVPEVRDAIYQRHAAEQAKLSGAANLSVSGAPGGGAASRHGDKVKDSDLRSTLEAALDGGGGRM